MEDRTCGGWRSRLDVVDRIPYREPLTWPTGTRSPSRR